MPVKEKLELAFQLTSSRSASEPAENDVELDTGEHHAEDDERLGGAPLAHLPAAARDPVGAKRPETGGHEISHGFLTFAVMAKAYCCAR